MRRFPITFAGLLAMGMLILLSPGPAKAQDAGQGCNAASITGNFGFMVTGWNNVGSSDVPVVLVGKLVYDGMGGVSGTVTSVQNGVVSLPSGISGSYKINPDCTGASLITPANSNTTAHFNMVVSGQGSMIYFIQTDNGNTVSGTATRQGQGPH
ncbi:MAG TPA: hypothetical protein VMG35_10910 [Bryobacteraceae bacterium]|nr:hypothetical protein [Bryobacteraceae bacterium]